MLQSILELCGGEKGLCLIPETRAQLLLFVIPTKFCGNQAYQKH